MVIELEVNIYKDSVNNMLVFKGFFIIFLFVFNRNIKFITTSSLFS